MKQQKLQKNKQKRKQRSNHVKMEIMHAKNKIKKVQEDMIEKQKENKETPKQKPITGKSKCDVYRNNKQFLGSLQYMFLCREYEEIKEKFGAKTLKEAEKKFDQAVDNLPDHWVSKLRKKFNTIKPVFMMETSK